jgi:competence protein ComEC
VQASLLIGLLPIMAFFFGGFAPAAPVYNALYIPIFSLILVPALFISLIGQGLSHYFSLQLDMNLLWQFIDWLLTILLDLTSYSQFWWVSVSKAALLMFVLFSICIVMRLFTPWAALLLIVLPLTELLDDEENNSWTLTVLDIGHGLAVLIEKNESFWLFDTGASWDSGSMVQNVISPVLHHRGAKDLETAIFSHADNDHAGGREDLIAQWNPQRLISPQWHLGNTRCVSGQNWEWHGLDIRVLWPEKLVPRAYNPHSCVVKVSDGKHSVLLTGDIDAVSEYLLYHKQYDQLDSDIILVPHHGSNTSSRTKFIQAVSPQIAIASLAKSGRWRLPSTSVVERYQAQGAIWMDTATSGQITVNLSAEGIHITTQRSKNEDLWFRKRLRWQN